MDCAENNKFKETKEIRIFESLRRFKHRPTFVMNKLHYLLKLKHFELRNELIELIVILMRKYSDVIGLQFNAIACLFNLTQHNLIEDTGKSLLKNIFDVTIIAMESFPNDRRLQENGLSILCNERILQNSEFDFKIIIDIIIALMEKYQNSNSIQINAILGLFNITKDGFIENLDSKILEKIGNLTLSAMNLFPNSRKLLKISLALLCHDRIVENLSINKTELIDLTINFMQKHSKVVKLQYNAISCFINLTADELAENINSKKLEKIVEFTLIAMELFPNHEELQENALSLLFNDHILGDIEFDKYKCAQLVMDSIVAFEDSDMNQMAVSICVEICPKLSVIQKTNLCSKDVYMKKILEIVRSRAELLSDYENILDHSFYLLSDLTNESPKNFEIFINNQGIDLYLIVLKVRF